MCAILTDLAHKQSQYTIEKIFCSIPQRLNIDYPSTVVIGGPRIASLGRHTVLKKYETSDNQCATVLCSNSSTETGVVLGL
jgi:hypothetical protein